MTTTEIAQWTREIREREVTAEQIAVFRAGLAYGCLGGAILGIALVGLLAAVLR